MCELFIAIPRADVPRQQEPAHTVGAVELGMQQQRPHKLLKLLDALLHKTLPAIGKSQLEDQLKNEMSLLRRVRKQNMTSAERATQTTHWAETRPERGKVSGT